MSRAKRQRKSLSLRLQPYEGDPLAEVVDYLNSLPKDEVNRKVADVLVAAFLPYARYECEEYGEDDLRKACWEAADLLNKHGSMMRLALGVEQPQFVLPSLGVPYQGMMGRGEVLVDGKMVKPEEDLEAAHRQRPGSLIRGQASSRDVDSLFGDG